MAKGIGKSWLVPLVAGVAIGWLFSGTIGKFLGPIAGHVGIHPMFGSEGYEE